MQVRRWKHMSGETHAGTPAHEASASGTAKPSRRVAVQFINASHPRDVVSTEAKKRIRSHAAKDVHASRNSRSTQGRQMARALHRLTRTRAAAEGEGQPQLHAMQSLVDLLSYSRKDPFQSYARPITEKEHYLIDHYITIVVPSSNSYCDHGDAESLYLAGMKSHWFPLAISDVGLLCGLLLAACRSMIICEMAADDRYTRLALLYKGECIKSTNESVIAEGALVSDATIAKALIMCSDEFLCGNMENSRLHAEAIVRMVALKGGLHNLGVGGFLRHLVSWCIFNPAFGIKESLVLEG